MSKTSQVLLIILAVLVVCFCFWYFIIDRAEVDKDANTIKDTGGVYVPSLDTGGIDISFKEDVNDPNIESDYKNAINIDMKDLFNVNTLLHFDHYGNAFSDPDDSCVNHFSIYADGSGYVATTYTMGISPGDTIPGFSEVSDGFSSVSTTLIQTFSSTTVTDYVGADEMGFLTFAPFYDTVGIGTFSDIPLKVNGVTYSLTSYYETVQLNAYLYYIVANSVLNQVNLTENVTYIVRVDVSDFFKLVDSSGREISNPIVLACEAEFHSGSNSSNFNTSSDGRPIFAATLPLTSYHYEIKLNDVPNEVTNE